MAKTKTKPRNDTKSKSKPTKMTRRSNAPPRTAVIRRNAAPVQVVETRNATLARRADEPDSEPTRASMGERLRGMNGGHVATAIGTGAAGNVAGMIVVGQGWVSPKTTAASLIGTGALAAAAGYYWESDSLMAAGAGLASAGTFSLVNQYAVDAYEAIEERTEEKQKEREQAEQQKRVAAARAVIDEDNQKRNGRRIVIVREDPESAAA